MNLNERLNNYITKQLEGSRPGATTIDPNATIYKVFVDYQDDDGYGQEATYLVRVSKKQNLEDVLEELSETLSEGGFMYIDIADIQDTTETLDPSRKWEVLDIRDCPEYDADEIDDDDLHWSY